MCSKAYVKDIIQISTCHKRTIHFLLHKTIAYLLHKTIYYLIYKNIHYLVNKTIHYPVYKTIHHLVYKTIHYLVYKTIHYRHFNTPQSVQKLIRSITTWTHTQVSSLMSTVLPDRLQNWVRLVPNRTHQRSF